MASQTDTGGGAARVGGRGSLWRERDFLIVWSGSLVSEMGDQVTMLALPLAAVLVLHAGAFELGALRAAGSLAFLLIALPAGIVVDRRRKRPLMIAADLGRLALSHPQGATRGHIAQFPPCRYPGVGTRSPTGSGALADSPADHKPRADERWEEFRWANDRATSAQKSEAGG